MKDLKDLNPIALLADAIDGYSAHDLEGYLGSPGDPFTVANATRVVDASKGDCRDAALVALSDLFDGDSEDEIANWMDDDADGNNVYRLVHSDEASKAVNAFYNS